MSDADKEKQQVRAEIESTRRDVESTVEELQHRLAPSRLAEQAKGMAREATIGRAEKMVQIAEEKASEMGSSLIDTAKKNPLPAALIGIGLGWLLMERSRSPQRGYYRSDTGYRTRRSGRYYDYDYDDFEYGSRRPGMEQPRERIREVGSQVSSGVSDQVEKVREIGSQLGSGVSDQAEKVRQVGSQALDQAGQLREQAKYQAREAAGWLEETLEENPLAVGAAALIVGAAIGFAVGGTSQEDRLMGEARDRMVDRAREMAEDTVQRVQSVAEATKEAALEEAKKEAQKQDLVGEPQGERQPVGEGMGRTQGQTGGSGSHGQTGGGTRGGSGGSGQSGGSQGQTGGGTQGQSGSGQGQSGTGTQGQTGRTGPGNQGRQH